MITLYSLSRGKEWDEVVRSFPNYDIYYLSSYVKAFAAIGDGDPYLLYHSGPDARAIYVYMKRPTAIPGLYDSITPYGYGGVLFDRQDVSESSLHLFWEEYVASMREEHVVDNFVRYNPLTCNAVPMKTISSVTDLGKTVAMDLASPGVIWENIISKNRNMIRKAEKNGVEIGHGSGMELMDRFIPIYNATMEKDQAEPYYFFGRSFYESICRDLDGHYEVFYATHEAKMIACSIMLFANGRMHYHLSGSLTEYRSIAPSNLLLYKAALWGCEQGFSLFHLGGGLGSHEDALFKFKAAFNRQSDFRFSIGREIFDPVSYGQLVDARSAADPSFDKASSFFPLYRSGL